MPTAARFIAALYMAIAGVIVIFVVVNEYEGLARAGTSMAITVAILGLFMGWYGMGRKIGQQDVSAISLGLRAGISMFIWALFLFALWFMIQGIIAHAYYQPLTAILSMAATMIAYGKAMVMNIPIMATIIVLSLIGGRVTKNAWLKWDQSKDLQINR